MILANLRPPATPMIPNFTQQGMFGGVSYPQFNREYNPYQSYNPFQLGSPYMMNPYRSMFSPFMQQPIMYDPLRQSQLTGGTPNDPSTGNPMFTNQEFFGLLSNLLPGVSALRGVGNTIAGGLRFFGGNTTPSTTDDARSMSSSQASSLRAADTSYGPSY